MSFEYKGPGEYTCSCCGPDIFITEMIGDTVFYNNRNDQYQCHSSALSEYKKVEQPSNSRMVSVDDVMKYIRLHANLHPESPSFEKFMTNEKLKEDPEYKEYLRLKDKFKNA